MVDPASDLAAVFDGGDFNPLAGTLTQAGADFAFTKGTAVEQNSRGGRNNRDTEEHRLFVLAADLGTTPRRDAVVVFDGEDGSQPWLVGRVEPTNAPDRTPIGYQIDLQRQIPRVGQ